MNPVIDRMLGLTADIAEELLAAKDAGSDSLPEGLKLKIISLAELAATVDTAPSPSAEPEVVEAQSPEVVEEPQEETYEVEPDEDAPCRNLDPADIFKAFSINDAFLYRREIFGGSRQRFMEALERVATLPDRQALQEYLVESLGLNLNKTPGKEFYQSLVAFF